MPCESLGEGTKVGFRRSSNQMSGVLEDPNQMIVLAQSLVASISDVTASVVRIELEQETFMEIGCYIGRTSPAIMELQTSENTPPNATEILQSLSKSVDHAKHLVKKCATRDNSIPNTEVRSIIKQLEGVIRNMGETLSLIPSTTFTEQEYAEVAIKSLSRDMQNAHFGISPVQISDAKEQKLEQLEGVIRNMGESLSSIPSSTFTEQEYSEVSVQSLSRDTRNAHFGISPVQVSEAKEERLEQLEGVRRNMGESSNSIPSSTFTEQDEAEVAVQSLSREMPNAPFGTSPVQVSEPKEQKLEQLEGVIRNMGESLSSIASSTFTEQGHAEVAVQSLSREVRNAHFGISPAQASEPKQQKLDVPSLKELPEVGSVSTDTDLYSVDVQYSTEISQSLDMPQVIDFLRGRNYVGQENHRSSSRSRSLKTLPQMVEYMEPLYETFYCPLSKKIMDDPVTVTSGVTYERKAIEEWFKRFEETSEDIVCPITGQKLMCRVLNTNIALKTTIEEWKERNEATRIKVARAALSLGSSDAMILEALRDLQVLCQNRQYNKVQVRNIGMIPLLTQFLEHKNRKVRCTTLETLQLLAEDDEESKETIAKTNAITATIKMLSSKNLPVRHASLCFLLELSTSESLCEKIGSVTGGILLLITMKYNPSFDAFTAEKAHKILRNLERSPANIKCMADNGLLEPLLNHLIEGSEETQMDMAAYLSDIVLGHDTKTYVAERASPILIKMVHSGNSLTRKAAFKALVQISSYQTNSRTLVEAGIVPIMIEEMFTRTIYNEPMNSKEESAAILASILDSGIALESIQVNTHGHTMASDYIVYNLIQMLKNSTPDKINISLIKILLCLTKSTKSTATIVSVVKETEASYTLIELINSPIEELGTATIKLLILLTPYMGHTLADRLCKTRGQPESLVLNPTETTRITEKHAVAANFLAKLPHQNLPLNLALLYKEMIPKIIKTINELQKSGTRTSKYANSYLEGLVGILVRFTTTLYEPQMLQVARKHNFTTVFTELLMRTSTDEIQRLSAVGLENLSTESINLSKPPQIKKTKIAKLFHLPKSLSMGSSKQRKIQLCPIHKGACSSETTFCLLDAKAIERLLACLDHENVKVVEAALSAICTLLDDKVDVDKSVSVLNEANGVQHVLNLLKEHKQEGLWHKSFWVIERFLTKGGDKSISDISHDRSLPSTLLSAFHHGDGNTRQVAEKILRHLNRMPNYSTQYF